MASNQFVDYSSVDLMPSEGHLEDFETMVHSFFQQIYTEELSVGAMIEILMHFKDSHVRR